METTTKLKNLKQRLILAFGVGLCIAIFGIMAPDRAAATENQEQVNVSPAQQAVNEALATATTEVQQAIAATDTATATIAVAQTEITQAQTAVSEIAPAITTAQSNIALIDTATATISSVDLTTNPIDQSSQIVQDAKATIDTATASVAVVQTEITQAQTEITQATTARTTAVTAQGTAQTELTQANIAIDNAQTAVNALQATIGNSTNVLAGVDDAGIRMNLPFGLLMGGTLYNNVFVGSNATITFGVDEGWVYYTTPNAPSVSIAGWDWTTWSTGTGITYATTANSLDIAWDVRPFPQTDASTQMVQIRFFADVNPTNGAWMADVSANGPVPNGARFNYRETAGGDITNITDTNSGAGFNGQISQGPEFTPAVDPNIAPVQAAVDAANATIAQLNASLTPVVTQNATNNAAISTMNSAISSLNTTVNNAVTTKNNLQTQLNTNAQELNTAITNYIPTPAPILSEPTVEGNTVTIAAELPEGYTANTWFYQVITDDPNAENPYEGQTLNTDGAPESIELTGLTEGATYTIRIANWSGPVSQYTEVIVSIPAEEVVVSPAPAPIFIYAPEQNLPELTTPTEEDGTDQEENIEGPGDETTSEDGESQDTDTPESDESSSNDEQDNSSEENQDMDNDSQDNDTLSVEEIQEAVSELISDGNLTTADAEAVLEALSADGEITNEEVANLAEVLSEDGKLTLAEKDLLSDALVTAADGAPVEAAAIAAAGLEYRDLPPLIPVEVREDANGNPVVITAEVASALLVLESPAALLNAIGTCFNPEEEIEGLTEEQKCELGKALLNIGADMSIPEREKAEDIVVVTIIAGQIIVATAPRRRK